jgi:hypothetical protein
MVVLKDFMLMVPPQFSKYRLSPKRVPPEQDAKLFLPTRRFATCAEAVAFTVRASGPFGEAHDAWANACLAAAGPDYAGGRLT